MGKAKFLPMEPGGPTSDTVQPRAEGFYVVSARHGCHCTRRCWATLAATAIIALFAAGLATWYFLMAVVVPTTLTDGVSVSSFDDSRHVSDATWWGHSLTKIARRGRRVFTYKMDNSAGRDALHYLVLLGRVEEGNATGGGESAFWREGARIPALRPGNLLLDPSGGLHVIVVQPGGVAGSGPILAQYTFPAAGATGNIVQSWRQEVSLADARPQPGALQRFGAATNASGALLLGFGTTLWLPKEERWTESQMAVFAQLSPRRNGSTFTVDSVAENLGYQPYFPYALVTADGPFLMPVEEECLPDGGQCQSREIRLFHPAGLETRWRSSLVKNAHDLPVAVEREQLLQQSDLFQDAAGTVHAVYKEFSVRRTDGTCCDAALRVRHLARGATALGGDAPLDIADTSEPVIGTFSWVRLVEAGGELFYVATAAAVPNYLILQRRGSKSLFKVVLPSVPATPLYVPFASQPKTGTRSDEGCVDILLLASSSTAFPSPRAFHVRIEKRALLRQVT